MLHTEIEKKPTESLFQRIKNKWNGFVTASEKYIEPAFGGAFIAGITNSGWNIIGHANKINSFFGNELKKFATENFSNPPLNLSKAARKRNDFSYDNCLAWAKTGEWMYIETQLKGFEANEFDKWLNIARHAAQNG